jgi:hypothetical protein
MGRYGVSRIGYNLSYMPDKEKAALRSGRRHFRFALIRGAGLPAPLAWVTSSSRSQMHPEGSGGHVAEPALSGIPPAARIAATGCCTQVAAGVARRHRHPGVATAIRVACEAGGLPSLALASATTPRRGSRHGPPPDRHVYAKGKQHRRRHPAASERDDVVAVSAICRRRCIR